MNCKWKTKGEKGITLIALIITIILLIILAAVSLRTVMGEGILQVATDGVRKLCTGTKE